MADPQSVIPQVADEDVEWIRGVMGLREIDRFRQEFLRARTTLDVSACPGSGKTTLIVAKLAIMAKNWSHRTKGICVLSHTNAARGEIQRRLCGTVVGQQLLSYPHFIDTIHGFVNRFLALPWLNSNGFPAATVDDDVTSTYRRRVLGHSEYWKVENFLRRNHSGFDRIRVKDRNLDIWLGDRPFPARPSAETHQLASRAVQASSHAGYFCYDEMFVWAKALLEDCPSVATLLQLRFPLVIVDEMQDTSDLQVGILEAVFPRTGSDVSLQRVGDPNQAIFDGARAGTAVPGGFPDAPTCLKIPNSFRFGPAIATLASPFAVDAAGPDGLQGVGPRPVEGATDFCPNALFIFQDAEARGVLNAYGHHVLSCFGDVALAIGDVAAVGSVHQDASDVTAGAAQFPKTVPHYWSEYSAEVGSSDPHPRTLIQYVRVARAVVRDGGDLAPGVEKIASGLVRLARRAGGAGLLGKRAPRHRAVVDALSRNAEAVSAYRRLLRAFLIDWETLSAASWAQRQADILLVAAGLGASGTASIIADEFLGWDPNDPSLAVRAATSPQDAGPNVYRVEDGCGRRVDIRLGSVHSMKGQTHLATLLLSTYWHEHSAKRMLPWLLGERTNLSGAGVQDRARLQQTYVAMTRPSHLICLAIPRTVLGEDAALTGHVATLKERGWRVADVVDGAASWYS
ncbi:MAG: ATP-dependent helicase [Candidatus Eisenbacteria bacterium]|nr:ATP-dependent helicase [Candidatus Eisenbacteria bacterium]